MDLETLVQRLIAVNADLQSLEGLPTDLHGNVQDIGGLAVKPLIFVLQLLVCSYGALSIDVIASLLDGTSTTRARQVTDKLQDWLTIQGTRGSVRFAHGNTRDLLLNPNAAPFYIDRKIAHHDIVLASFALMARDLRHAIGWIPPRSGNSKIRQMNLIAERAGNGIRYAARFWPWHMENAVETLSSDLRAAYKSFFQDHLLDWMVFSSLMGIVGDVISDLVQLRERLTNFVSDDGLSLSALWSLTF